MRAVNFILENPRSLRNRQKWIHSLLEPVLFLLYRWPFNLGLALTSCKYCFPYLRYIPDLSLYSWSLFNSITDAPKEFQSILEDLRLLRTLLASIQETEEVLGPDAVMNEALEICKKSIRNLTKIVDSLAPGFASQNSVKRKWTAIEAVMKTEEILKFKAGLEEAKSSLILAQSISLE
jgi:hypothetical protein